jgi:hypothetical protein
MNAKNIKFMLAMQQAIEAERQVLGENHQQVQLLQSKFDALWQRDFPPVDTNEANTQISSSEANELAKIRKDVQLIKERLHLHRGLSVDYSFVDDDNTRAQLQFDNLRMENNIYDLHKERQKNIEHFHDFCVSAFLQVEELINYYFVRRFPDFTHLLAHLDKQNKSNYTPTNTIIPTSIFQIPISRKLWAFGNEFFPYHNPNDSKPDHTFNNLQTLRLIRNESAHRCTIIKNENKTQLSSDETKIRNFFEYNTPQTVRALLQRLAQKIADNLRLGL